MTVRTNPPGALLYVDDYEIGTTPVSANFTYYGTRKIRLVKDGYETLTVMQWIPPPWYEFPPHGFRVGELRAGPNPRPADTRLPAQAADGRAQRGVDRTGRAAPAGDSHGHRHGAAAAAGRPRSVRPPSAPPAFPPPAGAEVVPAPEGVGGQPVHPLPPR